MSAVHLEVVGDRTEVADRIIRLGEDGPRGIAVAGPRRIELFERSQPALDRRQVLLARAQLTRLPLPIDAGIGQRHVPVGPRVLQLTKRRLRRRLRRRRRDPFAVGAFGFRPHVGGFDIEARELRRDALTGLIGMFDRVAQRRGGVHGGKDRAARRLDVPFEPFDVARGAGLVGVGRAKPVGRLVTFACDARRGVAAGVDLAASRLAPLLESIDVDQQLASRVLERDHLLALGGELLLPPLDRQLFGVSRLARLGGSRFDLGERQAQLLQVRLEARDARGRAGFRDPRLVEARSGLLDGRRERRVALREENLFPAP